MISTNNNDDGRELLRGLGLPFKNPEAAEAGKADASVCESTFISEPLSDGPADNRQRPTRNSHGK